jgi:hypothetical protein
LFNNAFSSTSAANNEHGVYFGFRALLFKHLILSGYFDLYLFSWLRYRVDAPSAGRDYQLQLNFTQSEQVMIYLRYRYRFREENNAGAATYTNRAVPHRRHEFRYFISYQPLSPLIFKNRIGYVLCRKDNMEATQGFLIYQDILFRPADFPVEATFRYALFNTDGYDTRLYTYEYDVRYAFSIPAYSGIGQRVYLMIRCRAVKGMDVWIRLARTIYTDRRTIGSGCDEIRGNTKTEIKIQLQLKF